MKNKSPLECAETLAQSPKMLDDGLTHDENLRGSALALACRYYTETIVKDGELYREMVRDNRVLKPATYEGVLEVALAFVLFLRGELRAVADDVTEARPTPTENLNSDSDINPDSAD